MVWMVWVLRRDSFCRDTLRPFYSCMVGMSEWHYSLLLGHLYFLDKHVLLSCLLCHIVRRRFDTVHQIVCINIVCLVGFCCDIPTWMLWAISWAPDTAYWSYLKTVASCNRWRDLRQSILPMLAALHCHTMRVQFVFLICLIRMILIFEHLLLRWLYLSASKNEIKLKQFYLYRDKNMMCALLLLNSFSSQI